MLSKETLQKVVLGNVNSHTVAGILQKIFPSLKLNNYEQRMLYQAKLSYKIDRK